MKIQQISSGNFRVVMSQKLVNRKTDLVPPTIIRDITPRKYGISLIKTFWSGNES